MMVASSVVLPTPFLPSTANAPRAGSASSISSRTPDSPYPARTPVNRSASDMALLPEVDFVHALVPGDLLRRPLDQHFALHQNGDALREAEHQIHVVLDDQDRDVLGELVEHLQDAMRFQRRHARGGLVEEQHLGVQSERDRDFHQALFPVRQVEDADARVLGEPERGEQFHALVADVAVGACRAQHARRDAAALGHRERHVVEHRKAAEEGVDLEGSPQSELHALGLPRSRDVFPAEHDPAGGGGQHAGEHIDEGGLSGTVRTDERVARARLQPAIYAGGHGERAEALAQAARLQSGDAHCFLLSFTRTRSRMPSTPPRANITTSTSSVPMPKYQYSGNCLASRSCAIRYTTGPTKAP